MSDFGFGSFASLRKSAQELSAKAAASVQEQYNKNKQQQQQIQVNATLDGGNSSSGSSAPVESGTTDATTVAATPRASATATASATENASATSPAVATPKPPPATTTTTVGVDSSPGPGNKEVDKKELLEILGKMNKKVKTLSSAKQQLTQQLEQEQLVNNQLRGLIMEEILAHPPNLSTNATIQQLQAAWRQKEEQEALVVQSLQQEFHRMQQEQQQQQQQLSESKEKKDNFISKETHEAELSKLKEAHDSSLKSFKEKISIARKAELEKLRTESAVALQQQRVEWEQTLQKAVAEKDAEMLQLKAEHSVAIQQQVTFKEKIEDLENSLSQTKNLLVAKDTEIQSLQEKMHIQSQQHELALAAKDTQLTENAIQFAKNKDQELAELRSVFEFELTAAREQLANWQASAATTDGSAEIVQQLQSQQASLEQDKRVLLNDLRIAQEELALKNSEWNTLQQNHLQQLSDHEQQFEILKQQVTQAQQLVAVKSHQLEEVQKQLAEKELAAASLTKDYQQLAQQSQQMESNIRQQLAEKELLFDEMSKEAEATRAALAQTELELLQTKALVEQAAADRETLQNQALAAQQEKLQHLHQTHLQTVEKLTNGHDAAMEALKTKHSQAAAAMAQEKDQKLKQLSDQVMSLQKQLTEKEHVAARVSQEKDDLRKKMEDYVDKMTTQFKAKLADLREQAETEAKKLQAEKEEVASKLAAQLRAASLNATALKNENEDLKAKLARTKEEMQLTVENNSATATSLIEQQEKLEREKGDLEALCQSLEKENRNKSKTLEELHSKITSLEQNLGTLSEEKYELDLKIHAAARTENKLRASQAEVLDLREQLNKLKLEGTKNANLVARLLAEKDTNERSHGERTALVAMLENQLSDMNDKNAEINARLEASLYDLSQKDETILYQQEQLQRLELDLAKTKELAKRTSETLAVAQKSMDNKSNKQVEALQRELQATRQQMAKKSAAAQKLFQDRETECAELRKANKLLQQEVDKGTLSDRRIFELAAKQSNRESLQVAEIEIRDRVIENLKIALLERDGDLAFFEKHVREVEGQVEELCRVRRREDVNLDYLKSVVVKYLSLPSGSSERARLLPVLATLLQFNNDDYQTIEAGKEKLSWWGNIAPTLIGGSEEGATPPAPTSAEISVNMTPISNGMMVPRPHSTHGSQHRTSLQF